MADGNSHKVHNITRSSATAEIACDADDADFVAEYVQ